MNFYFIFLQLHSQLFLYTDQRPLINQSKLLLFWIRAAHCRGLRRKATLDSGLNGTISIPILIVSIYPAIKAPLAVHMKACFSATIVCCFHYHTVRSKDGVDKVILFVGMRTETTVTRGIQTSIETRPWESNCIWIKLRDITYGVLPFGSILIQVMACYLMAPWEHKSIQVS